MNRPAVLRIARARLCACAALSLLAIALSPAVAGAAARTSASHTKAPLFPIPASARVHSETHHTTATTAAPVTAKAPATTTPATAVPPAATTTPAATPATTTPPATAPATPGSATPATTTPPATAPAAPAPGSATQAATAPPSARLLGARAHTRSSNRLSTGAIVGAAIAGLLVLLCLAWAVVRWFALEPRWTRSLAYSLEEAGFRASTTFSELLDWARLGR